MSCVGGVERSVHRPAVHPGASRVGISYLVVLLASGASCIEPGQRLPKPLPGVKPTLKTDESACNPNDALASMHLCEAKDGFCWLNPPYGLRPRDLTVASEDEAWVATGTNVLLHLRGTKWEPVALPFDVQLSAVWARTPNDVWAVGANGVALHYTGGRWSCAHTRTNLPLTSVSGSRPDDVWATSYAYVLHWDGRRWWTVEGIHGAQFIHPFEPGRALAVGLSEKGCAFLRDGTWEETPCGWNGWHGAGASWGTEDDLWLVATQDSQSNVTLGFRAHWNGSEWAKEMLYGSGVESITGLPSGELWIDGTWRNRGEGWQVVNPLSPHLWRMAASGSTALGMTWEGIHRLHGEQWPEELHLVTQTHVLSSEGPNEIWAVRDYRLSKWDGRAWTQLSSVPVDSSSVHFGSASVGFWFPNVHWDGQQLVPPGVPSGWLQAGWTWSFDDALVVGPGRAFHWDGEQWNQIPNPFGRDHITVINQTADGTLFALGNRPGTRGDAWDFPGQMVIWRLNGGRWEELYLGVRGNVRGVSGPTGNHAFFIAMFEPDPMDPNRGLAEWFVLELKNETFNRTFTAPYGRRLESIAAPRPDDLWVSTSSYDYYSEPEGLFHFDGSNWTVVDEPLGAVDWIYSLGDKGILFWSFGGAMFFRSPR